MAQLPFYHIFRIYQKAQHGQDITWDDLARLYGDPAYHFMKFLDTSTGINSLNQPFQRGRRYIDRLPYEIRRVHEATNQAHFRRYGRRRSWKRRSHYSSRSRRY